MTFKDPDNKLSGALRVLLTQLQWEMQYLHRQVEESDKLIVRIAGELEACKLSSAFATTSPCSSSTYHSNNPDRHRWRCGLANFIWTGSPRLTPAMRSGRAAGR